MRFRVPHDHPALAGHFPGNPVVPGVVVLDHVLDAIEARQGTRSSLRLPQVKFLAPLLPGEQASVALEQGEGRWKFVVKRGDATIASGEVVAGASPS